MNEKNEKYKNDFEQKNKYHFQVSRLFYTEKKIWCGSHIRDKTVNNKTDICDS